MQKKVIILIFFSVIQTFSQTYNSTISEIVNQVSIDSLVKHICILSGEDSVLIDSKKHLITNRISNTVQSETTGHRLAVKYLSNYLRRFVPNVFEQKYPFRSDTIRNIIAIKKGKTYPEKKVIISGHYDSILWTNEDTLAPGADDNASGTAVVLEAARLLSQIETDYSIYFILWDWEEEGCVGSRYFVEEDTSRTDIIAMLNFDMIGYDVLDSNGVDLYYGYNSNPLNSISCNLNTIYNININLYEYFTSGPGDIISFLSYNICPLVMFVQRYRNYYYVTPYFHTSDDKIEHFNLDYYHRVSKLGIAMLLEVTLNGIPSRIVDEEIHLNNEFRLFNNYPNPFNNTTNISFYLPYDGNVIINVFDINGNSIESMVYGYKQKGKYNIRYNTEKYSSGIYFYQCVFDNRSYTRKMVLLK